MHKSLLRFLGAAYKANPPEMAADASPAAYLSRVMRKLSRRWLRRFDDLAEKLADSFADGSVARSDAAMRVALKDAGFTVEFHTTRAVNDILQATITENVGLIRSIAQEHLSAVEGMVMRSVTAGRDLKTLTDELQTRFGVTRRRAAFIARDQNNKATSAIQRARQTELGITQAIWLHSGAGKHPRPEHVAANGKVYDVAKGMYLDGKWTFPGMEPNCRCCSRAVIPGFSTE